MNSFYVYMYLRSKNSKHGAAGSPYYIGKGKGMRAYSTNHRVRPPVDRKMVVFVALGLSEQDAHQAEMFLICKYGRIDNGTGCLRNLTDGGEGPSGLLHSQQWKEDAALRAKMRPPVSTFTMAGREHREDSKARCRASNLSSWTDEKRHEHSEMMRSLPNLHIPVHDTPHSEASKEKMRQAHLGKRASRETKRRMSESHRNRIRPILTHCKNGHLRTPETIRPNGKGCAVCHREWAARKQAS